MPAGTWNGTLFLLQPRLRRSRRREPRPGRQRSAHRRLPARSRLRPRGLVLRHHRLGHPAALPDQIATLDAFTAAYGKPSTTIAWGHSLGGIITAGLIQDYPGLFSAALPMCGVLSGGVATWNTALDAEFAFQQLIDPRSRS